MSEILLFPYYGSKRPWIDFIMPAVKCMDVDDWHFVSLCFGSGAFELNKPRFYLETFNDMDELIVNLLSVLRADEDKLIRALKLTPWSRSEQKLADGPIHLIEDPIERARLFYVRVYQGFDSLPSTGNGWKFSVDPLGHNNPPRAWKNAISQLHLVADRLSDAQIEKKPLLEMLVLYDSPRSIFFIDPPYTFDSRNRKRKCYNHEMTEKDHKEMAKALLKIRGRAILCGYQNPIYTEILKDWICIQHKEKVLKSSKDRKAFKAECLWLNYELADELPLFAGSGVFA